MVKQVIKKIISLILVSTMLIGNICTYVSANDFKLSIIYMLDAIEDMEYKEREEAYKKEHESFIAADENNENVETTNNIVTSDLLGASDSAGENDFVGASTSNPNFDEEDTTTSEYEIEPEEDKSTENSSNQNESSSNENTEETESEEVTTTIEASLNDINANKLTGSDVVNEEGNIATSSDAEGNDGNSNEEEKEDDTITQSSNNTNVDIATKSEIEDAEKDESEEAVSTPSDTIYIENADVSTKSEIKKYELELEHIATISEIAIATVSELSEEVRKPENYYSKLKSAEYDINGTLVEYDQYSRTYLVEENVGTNDKGQKLNRYVKFIGAGRYYVDESGELRENSNTLVKKEKEPQGFRLFDSLFGSSDEESNASDEIYINAEGQSEIEVSSNGNDGYTIRNGEQEIKIIPVGGDYSKSEVLDNAIRYSNVFDMIDVQYTIIGDNVKEDIILLNKTDINEFSYRLELNGLSAAMGQDAVVIFNSDGKVLFNLTAPYIIDNEGNRSSDIEIKFDERENIVTYIADKEVLEKASYPVRIDPGASVIVDNSAIQMYLLMDGRTTSGNVAAAKNQHIDQTNQYYYPGVGYRGGVGYCRQMIYINPDAISSVGTVDSADFAVTTLGCDTNGQVPFVVKQITNPWNTNTINWNEMVSGNIDSTAIWNGRTGYSEGAMEEMTFDITSYFTSWNAPETSTLRKEKLGLIFMSESEPAYDGHSFSSTSRSETFLYDSANGPRIQLGYVSPNANQDLFMYDVSDSYFELGAATKKSNRGGQTMAGVVVYGIAQTGTHGPKCEHDGGRDCSRAHNVTFSLYNYDTGALVSTNTVEPVPSILYPDYKLVDSSCKDYKYKDYNVQSSPFVLNSPLRLNVRYYAKALAKGCRDYEAWEEEVEVDDDYSGPPIPPIKYCKHIGGTVDSGTIEVEDSMFLLYKVQYGDVLEKIAGHYGVEVDDIARDNHFNKLMCYEGDILFIRNPQTAEPYENDLPPELLAKLKELIDVIGYEAAMCAFGLEPVNMSTGDFYLEHTDAVIPELGDTDFKISRSYNSIGRIIKSDFGYGFNSIVNDRLMVNSDGTVMHFRSDGGGETYHKGSGNDYIASKGYNVLRAVKNENGDTDSYDYEFDVDDEDEDEDAEEIEDTFSDYTVAGSNNWQLIYENGDIATYNSYGSLLSKTDKKGLTYTYTYDSRYRVIRIGLPSGLSVGFSYNDKNLISRVTLPDSTYISYEYDTNKNLIKVTDAENRVIRYEYDSDHKMTAWYDSDNIRQVLNTYDSQGRVIKQVDANGSESTISYYSDRTIMVDNLGHEQVFMLDSKKRTTEQLFGSSSGVGEQVSPEYIKIFDSNSKVESKVDANGVTTTYTYDSKGNVIKEEKSDGEFTISKTYTYDINNNVKSETDYNGNTTTYTYDAKNNLTKITDASGNTEEMAYDSLSRITSKKDKNGNITRYRYTGNNPKPSEVEDARGNITRFTYDGMRRQTSETDSRGFTSSTTYDRTGRKVKETDKRGNETNYTYSSRGTVTSIKDREDNISTFTYDSVGNILTGTDGESNTLIYEYDQNYNKILEKNLPNEKRMLYNNKGQVIEEIDALNHSKTYTLDGIGNIIKEIDRNGNEINYRYNNVLNKIIEKTDGNSKITRYNYDNNGNLLKEIKADNSEINYEYNALNQLTKTTNEEGIATNFTYDANGNIIKKAIGNVVGSSTSPLLGIGDNETRTTEYTYDECNNLIEEKSPNGYINKCEYDQVGNIIKLTDENNYSIEYTYDGNCNITKIKDAENHTEEYIYNKENKILTYKDKNGNITRFTYDRAGRVVEKINALNEKEKLEYDSNDNITKNILYNSDGSAFSETNRTYNALNNLVEEIDSENHTTTYAYDNNENITAITNKNGDTKTFTYDASNNVIATTDEMGLITQYEYDDVYNIVKVDDNSNSTLNSNGVIIGASSLNPIELREYDRIGNLTKLTDAIGRIEQYEYNIFGEQVKKIDKDNAVTNFEYDNNGNLTKVIRPDNQELLYTYDKHNKLIKTKLNDVVYEYTYDKNYNVVEEKNPLGNTKFYTYDNEGNTIEVKDEEENVTKNEYDSIGRVIKQIDGRNDEVALKYDRNNNVIEIKTAENIINKFEFDKEGRLTKEIDGENHFVKYEYDGVGNILKKTTESNEVTTYTYDKHNVMTSMTDALNNTERYETNLNKQIVKKIQKDGTIYKYNYDRAKRLINTIDPMNYRINMEYSLGDDIVKTTDTLGREVNYEYDILHNLTKKTDANGKYNLYTYDYRGNVIRHIDRRENIENFTYDLTDNLIEHKDKNENTTTYTYDKVGNITEVREPNGALTKYDYDANYNRIKVTNPRGKVTNYVYDRDNRLISETDPNGNTKRYSYNNNNNLKEYTTALGNTQKYEYDTDNNLIKEIDPRNKIKQYTYDKLHRLTKTTSELNNTANFTYDVVDNVIGIKDPKGTNTVFDYNDVGKVVQERSVDNTIRTYNYDRAGRLISKINKDQSKIAYDYDANDNIIAKYYLDLHNHETDDEVVYTYNGENQRLGMNDKSGLSRTLYDNNGNMVVSTSNQNRDIVRYEYDENNRLIKMKYPNDIVVTYDYDDNGNIKKVTDKDGLKTYYTYDDNDNEVIRTTGLVETEKRYDADNRLIRIRNQHKMNSELIDEYSYRYDSNNNIIEEIKREPYRKKINILDFSEVEENDHTIRVTKQTFTYDDENKLTDARVERLGMKDLTEPNVTTYHYEYDANGNRTIVEIKDDGLTLESTVYTYDRLNQLVSSREVTRSGQYFYNYRYDDNGNLINEERKRYNETSYTNVRRYEYTKDNKLEAVYSGSILLAAYTYDGDGTITSTLDRDLDLNQNLNINDHSYLNRLTNNQRQLINKVPTNDSFLYELTEYVTDKNRPYSETLMERDGTGQLSLVYTYGNQRINAENYNNLTGIYTYDGRGSVSAVIGGYGDFRASYWYDGLGNVKSQVHGYGVFGSGKKYYGYNAEQYNPVTGNQNLRARQVNIRRQRFLTEDTYLGNKTDTISINRYIYGNDNPIKFNDPSGFISNVIMSGASNNSSGIGCFGDGNNLVQGLPGTEMDFETMRQLALQANAALIHQMMFLAISQSLDPSYFEVPGDNNNVVYNDWYYFPEKRKGGDYAWCSVFVIFNSVNAGLANDFTMPSLETAKARKMQRVANLKQWYVEQGRYHKVGDGYIPKFGDVVFMNFNGQNHVGLAISSANGVVSTVEGNTNDGGSRDGGGVYIKQRSSGIVGYGDNLFIY